MVSSRGSYCFGLYAETEGAIMDDWKSLIKDIFANTVGGVIVLLVPTLWEGMSKTIVWQTLLIVLILVGNAYIVRRRCSKCEKKIRTVPSTTTGEGGAESVLSMCQKDFYFIGIAANKWIKKAPNFDSVMKKIIMKHGEVQFILLNPMSAEAEKVSIAGGNPPDHLKHIITENIKSLQQYKHNGLNVRVKVYSHMPVFRIAIVDINKRVYVGSYEPGKDGNDLRQVVLCQEGNGAGATTEGILKEQFLDYYFITWNDETLKEVDIDAITDEAYLATLGN